MWVLEVKKYRNSHINSYYTIPAYKLVHDQLNLINHLRKNHGPGGTGTPGNMRVMRAFRDTKNFYRKNKYYFMTDKMNTVHTLRASLN